MKTVVAFFLIFSAAHISFGQSLKRKYQGTYSGEIPVYAMDAGGVVVEVKPAKMIVEISADKITRIIGDQHDYGSYSVSSPEKDYYVIEMRYFDSSFIQRFLLYRKSKELVFKGIYPQPDATLEKVRN